MSFTRKIVISLGAEDAQALDTLCEGRTISLQVRMLIREAIKNRVATSKRSPGVPRYASEDAEGPGLFHGLENATVRK